MTINRLHLEAGIPAGILREWVHRETDPLPHFTSGDRCYIYPSDLEAFPLREKARTR